MAGLSGLLYRHRLAVLLGHLVALLLLVVTVPNGLALLLVAVQWKICWVTFFTNINLGKASSYPEKYVIYLLWHWNYECI